MTGTEILELAAAHGLMLRPASLHIIEMGLDFRVVIAESVAGAEWVLRIPRYPSVMTRAAAEGKILKIIAGQLSVEVPDWQIHSAGLIAYPLLRGAPGVELDSEGEPRWNVDISAPAYVDSLAAVLAQIHIIPVDAVADSGIPIRTAAQAREIWRADIDRVAAHFTVDENLLHRWRAWITDESYWPEHSVFTHGEIYAGHTLVDNAHITGVIDWTTASVGDPARDLLFQQMSGSPESFDRLLEGYVRGGGRIWPRIREHCAEMIAANPVGYASYAVEIGTEELLQTAAQLLNPGGTD